MKNLVKKLCFLALTLAWTNLFASAAGLAGTVADPITSTELTSAIANHIEDVPEFKFLRETAKKMGVRVYLFGGTAAAYAHYVNWDLQREKGDTSFQKEKFDYDYTNIYHSSQDLDVVIDGNPVQAEKLQDLLAAEFPHFQGSKTDWEVRLLRQDMGDKQALLNNPDFLNQHTDSNSTGMVEITEPPKGEPIVKDLRDWENKGETHFLKDVREGKLHYYYSPKHFETTFYKQGRNPEIISVIRYLTKLFQYNLEPRAEDLARIQGIIDRFDPHGPEIKKEYVKNWLLKKVNGRKLIRNAQNMERAWNTLEKLGLRQKLIAIENNPEVEDSIAWWMSKEPLRTKPLGSGKGKTAAQIFRQKKWPIDDQDRLLVAHETNTFVAYESITKSAKGEPNVFISRRTGAGEGAVHGDGFYVQRGTKGARDTGRTVRFALHPDAREGTDFTISKTYLVVKNRAALTVIPQSFEFTLPEYLRLVQSKGHFSPDDLALIEKLKRKLYRKNVNSPADIQESYQIVKDALTAKEGDLSELMKAWFTLPESANYPELARLAGENPALHPLLVQYALSQPGFAGEKELLASIASQRHADKEIARYVLAHRVEIDLFNKMVKHTGLSETIIRDLLAQPEWAAHPEFVERILEEKSDLRNAHIAKYVLSQPHSVNHPEWMEKVIAREGKGLTDAIKFALSQPHWQHKPEWISGILEKSPIYNTAIATHVLPQPFAARHPEWALKILDQPKFSDELISALALPHWADHPEILDKLMEKKLFAKVVTLLGTEEWASRHVDLIDKLIALDIPSLNEKIIQRILPGPVSRRNARWLEKFVDGGKYDQVIAANVLAKPEWADRADLVEKMLARGGKSEQAVASWILHSPQWVGKNEWVETILENRARHYDLVQAVFANADWPVHPEWLKKVVVTAKEDLLSEIISNVLSDERWVGQVEVLELMVGRRIGSIDQQIADQVLSKPEWKNNRQLKKLLAGDKLTVQNLRVAWAAQNKRKQKVEPNKAGKRSCAVKFAGVAP